MNPVPAGSPATSVADLVGNTPLIRLRRLSDETGCEILGKAEFLNPGQSIKDRAALWIIRDAERRGLLRPGGTIVEGTAGNTGIGLTVIGSALGYRTVIVMPETQSEEKISALRTIGASLRLVPAVPYSNPGNYIRYSGQLAAELDDTLPNGAVWANQFDNPVNRQAHRVSTAPEIWDQTGGKVAAFVSAIGTGGTIAGVSDGLKDRNPDVKVVLADPTGSGMHAWVQTGTPKAEGTSITEGIGQGRVTGNLEGARIDDSLRVTDEEALRVIYALAVEEGLLLGGSTGINIAGAERVARDLGRGHVVVTMLCDHGTRYASKIFNPAFLTERDLPVPPWLEGGT